MRNSVRILTGILLAGAALSCGDSTAPNLPPTAAITGPATGASFFAGDPVNFSGSGTDPESGALTGSALTWASSLDGALGTGAAITRSDLTPGQHTVSLTARDPGGATGAAQVSITVVENQPPTVTIASPADDAEFLDGVAVPLAGSATDPESGTVPANRLSWSSSRDGGLGSGASLSASALSVGTHAITLSATDDRGLAGTATVSIEILPNGSPAATISEPTPGASFLVGDAVTFSGSASDPEDGALTGASLVWASDVDGQIGTGASFTFGELSLGAHTVTLTATDAQGQEGTATVEITVTTPTGLPPTAAFTASCAGLTCDFTDASTDPDGTVQAWSWAFGDGETSAERNPQHVFPTGGPFTVSLVATDDAGNDSDPAEQGVSLSTPALPGFQVEIRTSAGSTLTATQRTAVDAAVARWEEIVTGDLGNTIVSRTAFSCAGAQVPALNETIDDLVIYLAFVPIDGPGNVLGSAGPCIVRGDGLPVIGGMKFDTADLENIEAAGRLTDVILHEMGHVLGYGTLWDLSFGTTVVFDFLRDPTDPAPAPSNDTHFIGPLAIAAFDLISEPDYTAGAKVPVENDNQEPPPVFGGGSLNGHWREAVFTSELMTPAIGGGSNPISLVTIESLRDLGYEVDPGAADPFSLSFNLLAGVGEPGIELVDDIWRGPIEVYDAAGRRIGTAERRP